jgi:hypothetical protein
MLKSIYGFLFKDKEQSTKFVPTVDQIFSDIDIKNRSQNQLLINEPTISNENALTINNSITDIKDFKSSISEHITIQKQKHQEKLYQEELVKKPIKKISQWLPNDILVKDYNNASGIVGKVPNLLKKINQFQEKIISKQKYVDIIQSKKDFNPFDKFELIDYQKDILAEKAKITEIELQIENAQRYIDDPIFEEYALYLVEAEQYIKDTGLTGIMSTNDILDSDSVYIKYKSLIDSLKYGKKNPILMERVQFIASCFNMECIHENSRGKNLKELQNFFQLSDKTEDILYIFDKMDTIATRTTPALAYPPRSSPDIIPFALVSDDNLLQNNCSNS